MSKEQETIKRDKHIEKESNTISTNKKHNKNFKFRALDIFDKILALAKDRIFELKNTSEHIT